MEPDVRSMPSLLFTKPAVLPWSEVLHEPFFGSPLFAVHLLSDPNGPPTAFLLFRSQCTGSVSLPGPTGVPSDAHAGWHRGQNANPHLLHCCCTAEPARATKQLCFPSSICFANIFRALPSDASRANLTLVKSLIFIPIYTKYNLDIR